MLIRERLRTEGESHTRGQQTLGELTILVPVNSKSLVEEADFEQPPAQWSSFLNKNRDSSMSAADAPVSANDCRTYGRCAVKAAGIVYQTESAPRRALRSASDSCVPVHAPRAATESV